MPRTRLSPLDEIMPDIDLTLVLSFELASDNRQRAVDILSRAFTALLHDVPILTTSISKATDEQIVMRPGTLILSAAADPSIMKLEVGSSRSDTSETYKDLCNKNLPRSCLSPSVLGLEPSSSSQSRTVLESRIEFVEGGCFLIFRTSHAFVDATGLASIISLFADRCHQIADGVSLTLDIPACDALPTSLCPVTQPNTYVTLKHNPQLWHMLGLDYRPKEKSSSVLAGQLEHPTSITRLFSISQDKLKEINELAINPSSHSKLDDNSWISSNDVLAAWMWRCIIRARNPSIGNGATSTLMMPMNIRRLLSPPMERSYLGNAVIYSVVSVPVANLTSADANSGTVATTIRSAINHYKQPQLLSDCVKLSATIPNIQSLGLVYPTWLSQDVVLSSLAGLDLYNTSFGSTFGHSTQGMPDFVRFPQGMFDGINFVMPMKRNGSLEISVTMATEDMDRLVKDGDFLKFVDDIPS